MTSHKQPIKRVEIPLNKFNDVAVPHHVDLLKRHKSNIEKFQQIGSWDKMHSEQINATRLIKQLKALLYEMDMLRSQVQDSDLIQFDKLTDNARRSAQDAIEEYLVLNLQGQTLHDSVPESEQVIPELQVLLPNNSSTQELSKQEECLKSWESLQTEVQDVHQLFEELSLVVQEQKEKVDEAEYNTEVCAGNINEGASNLARAAKYKTAMYPVAGALLGGCLGGPIGLMAGFKLGGLAAIGCGVIGFTGGQLLKKKQQSLEDKRDVELVQVNQSSNVQDSVSLPLLSDESRSTFIPTTK